MKITKFAFVFILGVILSYLAAAIFGDASAGIFTSICYVGSLIYIKLSDNNSTN